MNIFLEKNGNLLRVETTRRLKNEKKSNKILLKRRIQIHYNFEDRFTAGPNFSDQGSSV